MWSKWRHSKAIQIIIHLYYFLFLTTTFKKSTGIEISFSFVTTLFSTFHSQCLLSMEKKKIHRIIYKFEYMYNCRNANLFVTPFINKCHVKQKIMWSNFPDKKKICKLSCAILWVSVYQMMVTATTQAAAKWKIAVEKSLVILVVNKKEWKGTRLEKNKTHRQHKKTRKTDTNTLCVCMCACVCVRLDDLLIILLLGV